MSRINFEFPNTCPKIDRAIGKANSEIENFLREFLEEACPLLPRDKLYEVAAEKAKALYENLESIFEDVRTTNEDMRREADSQIEELVDQVARLEHDLEAAA